MCSMQLLSPLSSIRLACSGLYESECEILGLVGGPALRAGAESCPAAAVRAAMVLRATALRAVARLFFG